LAGAIVFMGIGMLTCQLTQAATNHTCHHCSLTHMACCPDKK
jgi:hypothetical protein